MKEFRTFHLMTTKKYKTKMLNLNKKTAFVLFALLTPVIVWAQSTAAPAPAAAPGLSIDINSVLLFFAVLMLLPVYYTGKTFLFSAKYFINKKKNDTTTNGKIISSIVIMLCFSQLVFSQATITPTAPAFVEPVSLLKNWVTVVLVIIIVLEFTFIIYFARQTGGFLFPKVKKVASNRHDVETNWFKTFWEKINNFKPVGEEDTLDTGHNYDGIRELDNITPPWFVAGFVLSILFAISYLYIYHVAKSAPLPKEEYAIEMAKADAEKAKQLALQGSTVDENTVVMLGASDIANGKAIFTEKCVACHGPSGGSMPGGVGPNLTDDHWIHGGSIASIFKTIKYGWPEKGMISWKDQLTPNQIAQLSSFIRSIAGSNPPGAKEPQGDVWVEGLAPSDSSKDSSTKSISKDSVKVIK